MFTWKQPEKIDYNKKIAAVNTQTYQVEHLFKNVRDAAKYILKHRYCVQPTEDTIQSVANIIGRASRKFHQDAFHYYWEWRG